MAKWQTHYLEVVAPTRAWRFKSSPAHPKTQNPPPGGFLFGCKAWEESSGGAFVGLPAGRQGLKTCDSFSGASARTENRTGVPKP